MKSSFCNLNITTLLELVEEMEQEIIDACNETERIKYQEVLDSLNECLDQKIKENK